MDVELLVIPECSGADEAARLLRTALDDIGLAETSFRVRVVDTVAGAQARGFAGSPAFVVDGTDLFGVDGARGPLACRVYSTPEGLRNLPERRQLRRALKERAVGTGGG